ncbi:MAG: hypothetical protein ACJ752_04235 [Gaiellaceae bacterium]
MPPAEALTLFTPEGERRWAGSSWNPWYPHPAASVLDAVPGTVFTTDGDGRQAIWIVLEHRRDRVRYARVVADHIAGTVDVTCTPTASPAETAVTVIYDITSLGPEGVQFVNELSCGYDALLESWRQDILDALGLNRSTGAP